VTVVSKTSARAAQVPRKRPIFFNMRFLAQPLSGMQRYAEELALAVDRCLAETPDALDGAPVSGLLPQGHARDRPWRRIQLRRVGGLGGHAWEQSQLALAARGGILVSLAGSGPLTHDRHVLVLHDANPFVNPHFYSRPFRLWHSFLQPRLARRARRLLTISEFSRYELARCLRLPPDHFGILPDSAEHILQTAPDPETLSRHGLVAGGYALCVGNQSPNKNIALALSAFERLNHPDLKLAVAGGTPAALAAARTGDAPWLAKLGRVTDEELRTLYEAAALFIFPSIYEGFGIPPLEAMALGCPVVSADTSAMPEVLGDAAFFFRGGDAGDCAARIAEVLALDTAGRANVAAAGRAQAQRYTWSASADRLCAVLRDVQMG